MGGFTHLDDADNATFEADGYLIKRGLFSPRRSRSRTG
jgi:hypothetical protein